LKFGPYDVKKVMPLYKKREEKSKMRKIPILCVVGVSSSGKTSFIERLIPELKRKGLKIAVIKHDPHDRFEIDRPGKDSWRIKKAGADISIISSPNRIALQMDVDHDHDPVEILEYIPKDINLVLAEGYKSSLHPKIEVVKKGNKPICKDDPNLIAVIGEEEKKSQIKEITEFIIKKLGL